MNTVHVILTLSSPSGVRMPVRVFLVVQCFLSGLILLSELLPLPLPVHTAQVGPKMCPIREVSSFQRVLCTGFNGVGTRRCVLLERCPHFRGCYVQASMELGPKDVSY